MRLAVLVMVFFIAPVAAQAQICPAPLATATRLALVVAPSSTRDSAASLRQFERASSTAPWREVGGPASALIGKRGIAWAHTFRRFAQAGEPIKVDGDKRTPAGFFAVGHSFGFAARQEPGYFQITDGTVCVDDPASTAYNTITSRAKVGWKVHGENMWRISAYRHGIMVDYPTDRRSRAGSCIFIHLRLPTMTGTNGCVALPERQLRALQDFARGGAVLAIVPKQALSRFSGCLPQ
jgi:D-alanyl-D-alanine dipeptidase